MAGGETRREEDDDPLVGRATRSRFIYKVGELRLTLDPSLLAIEFVLPTGSLSPSSLRPLVSPLIPPHLARLHLPRFTLSSSFLLDFCLSCVHRAARLRFALERFTPAKLPDPNARVAACTRLLASIQGAAEFLIFNVPRNRRSFHETQLFHPRFLGERFSGRI